MQQNDITAIFDFLEQLRDNNNREWFAANKLRYDALRTSWLNNLQQLIDMMSAYDPSLRNIQAKDCAYRIYRDIRYSPDKTPYKHHFGAVIGDRGRKTQKACYYIHLEPSACGIYAGLWCPEPDILKAARSLVDAESQELGDLLTNDEFSSRFSFMPIRTLKKVPAGYDANHPLADILKAKDFTFGRNVPDKYFITGNWIEKVARDFEYCKPVLDFFNYVFE